MKPLRVLAAIVLLDVADAIGPALSETMGTSSAPTDAIAVPEPATILIFGVALVAVAIVHRRLRGKR